MKRVLLAFNGDLESRLAAGRHHFVSAGIVIEVDQSIGNAAERGIEEQSPVVGWPEHGGFGADFELVFQAAVA